MHEQGVLVEAFTIAHAHASVLYECTSFFYLYWAGVFGDKKRIFPSMFSRLAGFKSNETYQQNDRIDYEQI